MVRRVASLFGLLALLLMPAAPALAGDRAQIDLIGFSEDGSYFAFEEFGVQDGSGFAYASIYVVDVVDDSWVVGTPIRVLAEDELATLAEIRAEAQLKAANYITMLGIAVPGEFVAMIGDGVPDNDGQSLSFGVPAYGVGAVEGGHSLELARFDTSSATPCQEWFGSVPRGYQLSVVDDAGKRVVHRDDSLPRSRGCPVDYRLYGVVLPFAAEPLRDAVAIVSVYTFGFEGPDRRFIVVPLGF
jgi:predicted secreted protein